MQIVKVHWGELNREGIDRAFRFPQEVVYVWGEKNFQEFKERGYDAVLVSKDPQDARYSTASKKYYHKLEALVRADRDFDEYLLVDWDTSNAEFDQGFYEALREKSSVQCPLYGYHRDFYTEIFTHPMSVEMQEFFTNQQRFIETHSWDLNGIKIFPNFWFFYSRGAKIGEELMRISVDNQILSNVEEFALYRWASCSLEEYIDRHEPLVTRGQLSDPMPLVQDSLRTVNEFIESKVRKKIYIQHK